MELGQLFNQSFEEATLEWLLSQLINDHQVEPLLIHHHNSGEKALAAAEKEIEKYSEQGGVVHYQRNLAKVATSQFISTVVLDLAWIEKNIGQIVRIKSYLRGGESARQLFITLRLNNRIIVQYGLNSSETLHSSFKFDFSSRGYNLEFDDQIQSPLVLNQQILTANDETSWFEQADVTYLKSAWSHLSTSLKGDQ